MSDMDHSDVFNPFSSANLLSSFVWVGGLFVLGLASFSIAKERKSGKDSTTGRVYRLNTLWSSAYAGVFLVLLGFSLAYAYD